MKLSGIAVLAAGCLVTVCSARGTSYSVPEIKFETLVENDGTLPWMKKVLAKDGMFQVTEIPGFALWREKVLTLAGECLQETSKKFNLQDGAVRKSLVAATEKGFSYGFAFETVFGDAPIPEVCVEFETQSKSLRVLISRVANLVFDQIDSLCGSSANTKNRPFARALSNTSNADYISAGQFLLAGQHLEHFHGYQAECSESFSSNSLDLHTDDGLFIAFIPSMWVSLSNSQGVVDIPSNTGFYIQDSEGNIRQPEFTDKGNSLVFMLGEGVEDWFTTCPPMRSVPHSLRLQDVCDETDHSDLLRLWYGRMMMPPTDAIHEATKQTFGEIREAKVSSMKAFHNGRSEPVSMGCSHGRVLADTTNGCAEGEFYCWMDCRPWTASSGCTNSTPSDAFKCVDPGGNPWVAGEHCYDCVISCLDGAPEENTEGICNGYATSMYMLGFTGVSPSENCVVLLFPSWILDTPGKFVAGTLGAFFFGILTEAVVWARKQNSRREVKLSKGLEAFIYIGLFITQVTFGYFAMLMAMTYSVYIFIAIVLGLTAGHVLLNMNLSDNSSISSNSDPCCQFMEGVEPVKKQSSLGIDRKSSASSQHSDEDKIIDISTGDNEESSCCKGK